MMDEVAEGAEGYDKSVLSPSDDRHVALRAALTLAEINLAAGEAMTFDTIVDGTVQIYNFLKINKDE
jgi:hypothetical protein